MIISSLPSYFLSFILINQIYIFSGVILLEEIFGFPLTKLLIFTVAGPNGDLYAGYGIGYLIWCLMQSWFATGVDYNTNQRVKYNIIKMPKDKNKALRKKKRVKLYYHLKLQFILLLSIPAHYFLILMTAHS